MHKEKLKATDVAVIKELVFDNKWHHVAISVNNGEARFYLDSYEFLKVSAKDGEKLWSGLLCGNMDLLHMTVEQEVLDNSYTKETHVKRSC